MYTFYVNYYVHLCVYIVMSYYLCVYIIMHDYLCLQRAKEANHYICLRSAFLEVKNRYYGNRVLFFA